MDLAPGSVTTGVPATVAARGRPEWSRHPISRLRYTKTRGEWSLYWRDRNAKFHHYDLVEPTPTVEHLLAEIDADPTCICWG